MCVCEIKFMTMENNEEVNLKKSQGYLKFKSEIYGLNEKKSTEKWI